MSAPSTHRVMEVVKLAQATLDHLRQEDGLVLETEAEMRSALAEEGVSIDQIISRLGRAALDARTMVEMTKERMASLKSRCQRFEREEEMIRSTMMTALELSGIKSFRDPEFTASVKVGAPKVMITDADMLPDRCVRLTRTPDKTMIGWLLESGEAVPGAVLGNAETHLTLRCK